MCCIQFVSVTNLVTNPKFQRKVTKKVTTFLSTKSGQFNLKQHKAIGETIKKYN
jgi:hypothetical protein